MIFKKILNGLFQSKQKILTLEAENIELKKQLEIFEKRLLEYLKVERSWVESRIENTENSILNNEKEMENMSQYIDDMRRQVLYDIESAKKSCNSLFHEKHEMILEDRRNIDSISKHIEIVREQVYNELNRAVNWSSTLFHEKHEMILEDRRNAKTIYTQIYEELNKLNNSSSRLFHEKHEMIMKEHKNILEIVRLLILEYYKNENLDAEREEVVAWLRNNSIRMIPYQFYDEYMKQDICVQEEKGWRYVNFNNKKIFFPSNYTVEQIQMYMKRLTAEQDERSPHKYFDSQYSVCSNTVFIDCGAAEGLIGLKFIEELEELILVEGDKLWVEALRNTFAPYKNKVKIIEKYISNKNNESEITLAEVIGDKKGVYIIKIDIEGAEMTALNGLDVNRLDNGSEIIVCAYHKQDDESQICEFFMQNAIEYNTTKGFLLSEWGGFKEPFLRRGVIRGIVNK